MEQPLFGEPVETPDGTTVIPLSRPVGVFVVRDGQVKWEPAVDASRVALLAVTTGLVAATLGTLAVLRRPPWPDLAERTVELPQRARFRFRRSR
ncbi:GerW family sporulation protein [Amycolatopsis solani]|uniref:GerW family sporulation protein n=1 Tax=Amycolatopsis solani TaxID=3028615 RepID=UPI00296E9903|nr:GerW family sporulation protein [Amycolatopsis sp. MEP2-6]